MQFRSWVSAACLVAVLGFGSALRGADTAGSLLKQQLEQKKKANALDQEKYKATSAVQSQMNGINMQVSLLQKAPTEQQLADMKTRVTQIKGELESLEAQLAVADIKDEAQKKAKLKELQDKGSELSKKISDLATPFSTQARDMEAAFAPVNVAFAAALKPLIHDPKEGPAASLKRGRDLGWQTNFVGSIQWKDETGKDVIALALWLEAERANASNSGQKKIDNKYGYYGGTTNLSVRVGNFQVSMNIYNKPELTGDEAKLIALLKQIIDLEGLEAIKPE